MKFLFKLIKTIIILLFIGAIFLLITNKTFFFDVYKSNSVKEGIPINRFMYVIDSDTNIKFYTLLKKDTLSNMKKDYLDTLDNCYGIYYYDKDNNITITNYEILSKKNYNIISISYVKSNYCSNDYKLSDMWVYDYINKSIYIDGDILEDDMVHLIDKIYKSKRIDPIITKYKAKYEYKVNCKNDDEEYSLIFKDFNEDELLVKKDVDGKVEFAVYKIDNINEYMKGLK